MDQQSLAFSGKLQVRYELESFLSGGRDIDAVAYFVYVQIVPVNVRGDDNGFNKKHQC